MDIRFTRSWLRPFTRWYVYLGGTRLGEIRKGKGDPNRFAVLDEHGDTLFDAPTLDEAKTKFECGIQILQIV